MGSDVRLVIGGRLDPSQPSPAAAAERERGYVEDFAARLSRFRADSELCALNDDPRERVPCSALLVAAVRAAVWAAWRSGGLVDPTLVGALETAGYASSLDRARPAPLREALLRAPARRPARSDPRMAWRQISADVRSGSRHAPAGTAHRHRRHGQGPVRRCCRTPPARLHPLRRRLRRRPRDRRRRRAARPLPRGDRAPAHRRDRSHGRDRGRWGGELGTERARLAARGRQLRPPPPRPRDGRACMDRAGRGDGAGAECPGGRDARQDRAPARRARRGRGAAGARRPRRARRRRGDWSSGRSARAAACWRTWREAGDERGEGSDGVPLVARQPGLGNRRARPGHGHGAARTDDVGQAAAPSRPRDGRS